MSSPTAIPRTFVNMSAASPIDLTISPVSVRTQEIVIISDNEDENVSSRNRNNSSYHLNDNNNINSTLGQNIFNSSPSRHSLNNNQDSSNSNISYNLRSGLGTHSSNGSGPNRNTRSNRGPPFRGLGLVNFMLNVTVNAQPSSSNHNNRHRHPSAFHPYASIFASDDIHYESSNSSGSSRTIPSFFDSARTNTNVNSNDVQITSPPRRPNNNSPKPTTLVGHARDLDDSHTLICADCDGLLREKLWALSSCGHVVCGSCVEKYLEKKSLCPSCKKSAKPTTILQLYV